MKDALDNILRSEQATYLEALHGPAAPATRDPLFAKMEARAAERGYPISDPEVAMFLTVAAHSARPRFIVELGTNIGYGAIVLARAAEEARVVSIEYRVDLCEEARAYIAEAGLSDRIEVRQGLALAELEKIEQPIDLLYVDCVKEEYPRYLELGVPKLSERGLVIADNALWKGLVAHESEPEAERASTRGVRAFNLALMQDARLTGVVLPLGDGVAFAVKR